MFSAAMRRAGSACAPGQQAGRRPVVGGCCLRRPSWPDCSWRGLGLELGARRDPHGGRRNEIVPAGVEVRVAVPRLRPAEWYGGARPATPAGDEARTRGVGSVALTRAWRPKGKPDDRLWITDLRGIRGRDRWRKELPGPTGQWSTSGLAGAEDPGVKREVTNQATVRLWVAGYDLDRRMVWPESSSPTHVPTRAVRGAGRRPRRDPTNVGGRSGRLTGLSWPPRSFAVEGPTAVIPVEVRYGEPVRLEYRYRGGTGAVQPARLPVLHREDPNGPLMFGPGTAVTLCSLT